MNKIGWVGISVLSAAICGASVYAQANQEPDNPAAPAPPPAATGAEAGPVPLEWTPPALAALSARAEAKTSFTLDRAMLTAAAALLPDSEAEARHAAQRLDGLSVHALRFSATGLADPAEVDAIRQAYHLRGWKHLVSTTRSGGPAHDSNTDLWLVLDGADVRGAVVLVQSPRSLTLVTLAGNLNPVDLLHLRGHFGIPRFQGDALEAAHDR